MTAILDSVLGLLEFTLGCVTLLGVAFMVTLVLPDSPMKQFATKVVGWTVAFVCGLWFICPDPLPIVVDDIGALLLCIGGAVAAKRAGKSPSEAIQQVTKTLASRHERGSRSRISHHSDSK